MQEGIQKAGDVIVERINLVTSTNTIIDLSDFLVELNIYEDMFSNYMRGTVLLSDSRNLIELGPIFGDEFLSVTVSTPTFDKKIKKTFKVYKVSDRNVVRDNNTQTFILHFVSVEVYFDILLPLYTPFEGKITDIAKQIFIDYIAENRDYDFKGAGADSKVTEIGHDTPMYILNEASNDIKFVSPGWSPFKCLNWLASKAIPKNEKAKNFLFFETNKAFYFGSIEYLLKDVFENKNYIGEYSISASNQERTPEGRDINREYMIAKDVEMIETADTIKNYTNGYLASRLITLDVINKKYTSVEYDYTEEYSKQFHTSGDGSKAVPVFTKNGLRNPYTHTSFYPVNPRLFQQTKTDFFKNNVSEKMGEIYGNRRSSLMDISNLRISMTVPGRTDVEVGKMLKFNYPGLGGRDRGDVSSELLDTQYSGYYLITAIHHKINKITHFMTMECVKDSLYYNSSVNNG